MISMTTLQVNIPYTYGSDEVTYQSILDLSQQEENINMEPLDLCINCHVDTTNTTGYVSSTNMSGSSTTTATSSVMTSTMSSNVSVIPTNIITEATTPHLLPDSVKNDECYQIMKCLVPISSNSNNIFDAIGILLRNPREQTVHFLGFYKDIIIAKIIMDTFIGNKYTYSDDVLNALNSSSSFIPIDLQIKFRKYYIQQDQKNMAKEESTDNKIYSIKGIKNVKINDNDNINIIYKAESNQVLPNTKTIYPIIGFYESLELAMIAKILHDNNYDYSFIPTLDVNIDNCAVKTESELIYKKRNRIEMENFNDNSKDIGLNEIMLMNFVTPPQWSVICLVKGTMQVWYIYKNTRFFSHNFTKKHGLFNIKHIDGIIYIPFLRQKTACHDSFFIIGNVSVILIFN